MVFKHIVRSGCTEWNNCHQQAVAPVLSYDDNRSDLDHLRNFIASEVTYQHTAFLGLILKWHPWHSAKEIDSAQESGKPLSSIRHLKCPKCDDFLQHRQRRPGVWRTRMLTQRVPLDEQPVRHAQQLRLRRGQYLIDIPAPAVIRSTVVVNIITRAMSLFT